MDIASGNAEQHPSLLPYDPGLSPGLAPPTAIAPGQLTGPTVDAADTVGQQQERLSALEADCRAAQAAGMAAETDRRHHYGQDILPLGAAYGDAMDLPPVPPNVVPAEGSDLYPWSGMEPTPAGTGFAHPTPLPA
jgi:hypothetical protein